MEEMQDYEKNRQKSRVTADEACLRTESAPGYLKKTNDTDGKNAFERIYDVVRQIPAGTVATYGQVAALAGNRHWSRVVGYALHVNPDPDGIPCYRVVNRYGEVSSAFAFGGGNRQIQLLEEDGIPCPNGRVDLKIYQWRAASVDYIPGENVNRS